MPVTSPAELVDALRERQLLEPGQLEEIALKVPGCTDPLALARLLVEWEWLTDFQVDQVLRDQDQELELGPYRLLEPIGEGGMGKVFKAVQQRLNRVVALKIIRPERLSLDPEAVRRFQREAQLAAQLAHPNIVTVYDSDQVRNTYYLAMEYVDGQDLSQLVKKHGPLPVPLACDFIRQAALGLQHAHECGMVHRDIKPTNLLVSRPAAGRAGGRGLSGLLRRPIICGQAPAKAPAQPAGLPQGGVVKILDMGLVCMVPEMGSSATVASLTQEGSVMGTPDYIAPEQARNSRRVDIRADLYSLGCTFYFLLTGRPPFPEGTVIEKLLMHQLDQPTPIAELRSDVPASVLAVIGKLMAKRPEERFQTPAEVAEILASVPQAEEPPPAPAAPCLPAPAMVAEDGAAHISTAIVAVKKAAPEPAASEDASAPKRIASLPGHLSWVIALAFSPDRNLLASGGLDGKLRLWNFAGRKPRDHSAPRRHKGEIHALAFAPEGNLLASGSGTMDGSVWLWDMTDGHLKERALLQRHNAPVEALAFTADGKLLATGGSDKTIWLWDLSGPEPRERALLKGHADCIKALAFAPDGRRVASGGQDGSVRLWSVSKIWFREQAILQGHDGCVQTIAFTPDGSLLASGGADQTIRLWDLSGTTPAERGVLPASAGVIRAIQFSPDGQKLISLADQGRVIVWDMASGDQVREWLLPEVLFSGVAFTADSRYAAIGTREGKALVFRLANKEAGE